ncbi:8-oxo-dGTP diphosphatase [Amphibacillus marinus]|uniref:8-oxo-dGTP diphosphatase n=1 Tax=Amphibacillus marinus TaxID=872970 RepID=A0A1H8L0Y0_9BACI|nr:8-oxo-dGTP diphosphatase [Amphibacillus marinus]
MEIVHEYDFGIVHLSAYFCELVNGEPVRTEHESLKWLEKHELDSLDWAEANLPTVAKIQNR